MKLTRRDFTAGLAVGITAPYAIGSARVVLGHVAPKPWDASGAAKGLAGKTINADTAEAALAGRLWNIDLGPGEFFASGGEELRDVVD